jgi:GNAT superfamily N-acetyltransferase
VTCVVEVRFGERQPMYQIRPARDKDAVGLFALAKSFATTFAVQESEFLPSLAVLLNDGSACLNVAEATGKVVGYLLGFHHETFFADGPVGWVEEVMVAPEFRSQGIGRALMETFEAWAQDRNCKLIALATRRAAAFYRALSYEESATYFRKKLIDRGT